MRSTVTEFFAHQLNTDPDSFAQVIGALEHITGRKKVLEDFYEVSHEKVKEIFKYLNLESVTAEELYSAVEKDVQTLNDRIFELLDKPVCIDDEGCKNLIGSVLALHPKRTGFFVKRKVAESLLKKNPPKNILAELNYQSVDEMLEKEDLFEVYAALRFMEEREWLNSTYITEYRKLTADDFEFRPIEIRVLDNKKWAKVTEKFLKKKLHPMSHLKELGVIFVIPSEKLHDILTIYLFAMASHYLDEVHLYSKYFKHYSEGADFGEKIVSAIRGDVPSVGASKDPNTWLVIQRYLFKEDPKDPRLGVAHINPEALYHRGAAHTLLKLGKMIPDLNLTIWEHTNHLAVWLPNKKRRQVLVNFNLMDSVMSLMANLRLEESYSYHFTETLWNKLFTLYFSPEKLEEEVIKHLLDGWFDIRKI